MDRLCQRPTCSQLAAAQVRFDIATLRVVVEALDDDPRTAAVLCATHAARVTAPRGWTVDDLRVAAPPLFRDERAGATRSAEGAVTKFRSPRGPRGPRRRASQRADGDRPTPTEDASEPTLPLIGSSTPTGSDQPGPGASPGAPGAAAPGASAAQTPGMVALLDAASPLLFRAFAQPRDRGLHGLGALLPGSAAAS